MLRSEIPSGMWTKLRNVAASNNRDHARNLSSRTLVNKFNRSHVNIGRATTSQSLLLLLARATYIMVLFFAHIPFVVNHTIKATRYQLTNSEKKQEHFSFIFLEVTEKLWRKEVKLTLFYSARLSDILITSFWLHSKNSRTARPRFLEVTQKIFFEG